MGAIIRKLLVLRHQDNDIAHEIEYPDKKRRKMRV